MAGITVNVSLKDTELFKDIARILNTLLSDERVENSVRQEYLESIKDIMNKHDTEREYFVKV